MPEVITSQLGGHAASLIATVLAVLDSAAGDALSAVTSLLPILVGLADLASGGHASMPIAKPVDGMGWAGLILWLPLLSLALCGLWSALGIRSKLPAWSTVACLGGSFLVTLWLYLGYEDPEVISLLRWFDIATGEDRFVAQLGLYVDRLTLLWMLFVTGLGTLIAVYASEYMEHDLGGRYARFFAGVSVFLFAMSCLVMGDNLLMLYLGWEGVGFASYWLIGYFYQKPEAVAAAKKAFIVNRIGDLGLALGIYLIWHAFGTLEYRVLFEILAGGDAVALAGTEAGGWSVRAIPYLLMIGAFGKSAQLPLYVWLPDAMEGPTPVSALIHAATMVTAGVYLIARTYPLFLLEPTSLTVVAWVGTLTALLAATIGMAQYDIKRIMAYSTVSQLGYMFLGLGVLTTYGAAYHVFTHAFFKAVLFLTCGAIMHGFAGQLDLRKLSGLRHMDGWRVTAWTMLVGCLCLAGFPFTSGFFSKDAILAEAFVNGQSLLGWIALATAGLTAYYTFRVWFRVCDGPPAYELGDDHHGDDHDEHHGDHADHSGHSDHADHADHGDHGHGHGTPHPPRLAINAVLLVIALGAILAAVPYFMPSGVEDVKGGWVAGMVHDSSAVGGVPVAHYGDEAAHGAPAHADGGHADDEHHAAHGTILGFDPHAAMYFVSAAVGLIGIAIAFYLHRLNRKAADRLRSGLLANPATRWLPTAMENKWYVDEIYDWTIVKPLLSVVANICAFFDRIIVDRLLVDGIARLPRIFARGLVQPLQNGVLQSYALSMAGGIAVVAVLVLVMPWLMEQVSMILGGGG